MLNEKEKERERENEEEGERESVRVLRNDLCLDLRLSLGLSHMSLDICSRCGGHLLRVENKRS